MKNIHNSRMTFSVLAVLVMLCVGNISAQSSWATYTPPFGDTIGIADIEIVNENVIWAVGVRVGVDDSLYYFGVGNETYYAVTTDGGATWKKGTVPMGTTPFVGNIAATDAGAAIIIGLENFANGKSLKTTDGGTTWQLTNPNWDPVASWPDYIHAFTPAKYCVIGDPRDGEFEIYNTYNAGQVWQKVPGANIPDPIAGEFSFNNAGCAVGNTIWFATNQGRVYRSKNSGANWEVFTTPLGTSIGNISFSDENNGLASSGYGFAAGTQMYRTSDGGETWTALPNLPYGGHFFTFGQAAYIPNQPYLVQGLTPGGNLSGPYETWISPDRGDTWQQISSGEMIGWPTFISSTVGWAGEFQQLSHPTRLFKYTGSPLLGLFTPSKLDAEINISPNPASDVARVQVKVSDPSDFLLLLNDVSGQLKQSITLKNTSEFTQTFDLQTLPPGIYTLTVSTAKGSAARKFVKNKG